MSRPTALVLALALILGPATSATAQQKAQRFDSTAAPTARPADGRSALRPLNLAKWSTLTAALGVGAYGFLTHQDAQRRYSDLELACSTNPDRCPEGALNDGGVYTDPDLESLHQDIVTLDERATLALVASQLGLASSVALFILDMRESGMPPNDLYTPGALRVTPRPGGAELGIRLPVGPPGPAPPR